MLLQVVFTLALDLLQLQLVKQQPRNTYMVLLEGRGHQRLDVLADQVRGLAAEHGKGSLHRASVTSGRHCSGQAERKAGHNSCSVANLVEG